MYSEFTGPHLENDLIYLRVSSNVSLRLVEKNFGPLPPPAAGHVKPGRKGPQLPQTATSEHRNVVIAHGPTAGPSNQKLPLAGLLKPLYVADMPTTHSKLSFWVLSALLSRLSTSGRLPEVRS